MKTLARLLPAALVLPLLFGAVPSTAQPAVHMHPWRSTQGYGMTDVSIEPSGSQVFVGFEGDVPTLYRMSPTPKSRGEFTVQKLLLDSTFLTITPELQAVTVEDTYLEIVNAATKRVIVTHLLDASNDRSISLATLRPGSYFVLAWNERRASLYEMTVLSRR